MVLILETRYLYHDRILSGGRERHQYCGVVSTVVMSCTSYKLLSVPSVSTCEVNNYESFLLAYGSKFICQIMLKKTLRHTEALGIEKGCGEWCVVADIGDDCS